MHKLCLGRVNQELRQKNLGPKEVTDRWNKEYPIGTVSVIFIFFFYLFIFFLSVHTAEACTGPAMLCIWPVVHIQVWCILRRVSVLDTSKWTDILYINVRVICCTVCIYHSMYISYKKILTQLGFSLWVCPTFGEIVQQNRKSPSTILTAHNSTGNRTFMRNNHLNRTAKFNSSSLLRSMTHLLSYECFHFS